MEVILHITPSLELSSGQGRPRTTGFLNGKAVFHGHLVTLALIQREVQCAVCEGETLHLYAEPGRLRGLRRLEISGDLNKKYFSHPTAGAGDEGRGQ